MIFQSLHRRCFALGTILFTVTTVEMDAGLARRAYSSHPQQYPTSGTKPLTRDGWYDQCITGRQTFVANTAPEFARYFPDHALITAMGLGSCLNIPVFDGAGPVRATVNLLAGAQHFTAPRQTAYQRLVAQHLDALLAALA